MFKIYFNALILFVFLTPLSVCSANIPEIYSYLKDFVFFIVSFFFLVSGVAIQKDFFLKKISYGFFLPFLLSFFISFFHIFFNNEEYILYFFKLSLGRKLNILFFLIIFITLNSILKEMSKRELEKIIKMYIYGVLVFIVAIGIWQFLNIYFSFPIFKLNSRTHIHSAGKFYQYIKIRVTGLANEPSYAAPFLIDTLIFSYLFKYKKIMLITFFVLLLTYSGGGYINVFILVIVTLFYKGIIKKKIKIIFLVSMNIIFILIYFLKFNELVNIFSPVLNRFSKENNLFNIKYNIRSFMVVMPYLWIIYEKGIFPFLFGMGPGSYKYLSKTKFFYDGRSVDNTSNNLFSDFVYENGYLGLIMLIFMFLKILKKLKKDFKEKKNIYNKVNIILFFHLITTSLYRADFLTSRFWLIIIFINIINKLGKMKS